MHAKWQESSKLGSTDRSGPGLGTETAALVTCCALEQCLVWPLLFKHSSHPLFHSPVRGCDTVRVLLTPQSVGRLQRMQVRGVGQHRNRLAP